MKTTVLLIVLLTGQTLFAQGEALFRAKCGTCHIIDRDNTGPALQGVRKKWTDAGEEAYLYEWVRHSKKLIASGKSRMAIAIEDFSPSTMPEQQVTAEETDLIFDYIDSYSPPPLPPKMAISPAPNGPDYGRNLTLFYWLFGFGAFLLLTIVIMSNTIIGFLRSDVFVHRLPRPKRRENGFLRGAIIVGISYLVLRFADEFSAVSVSEPGERPWLLIEAMDLYLILGVDVFLVGVVVYLRRLFDRLATE